MNKTQLKQVTAILPFDDKYIKVGKGKKNIKWNLMDENGKLISSTWFSSLEKNSDGSLTTCVAKRKEKVEVKFIAPAAITSFDAAVKLVPASVISLVDTGTLEPYNMAGFVAKALADGIKTMQLPRIINLGAGTTPGASDVGESIKTFLDVKTLNALDSVK